MFRKLIASLLAITILFSSIPIAYATTETDPYYWKYGIKYEQLFSLYPQYLNPHSVKYILREVETDYVDVITNYGTGETIASAVLHSVFSGIDLVSQELLALFGLAQTEEEVLRTNSAALLMARMCRVDNVASGVAEEVGKGFGVIKDAYDISSQVSEDIFIQDLQEACKHLHDDMVREVEQELRKDMSEILGMAKNLADFSEIVAGVLELQELELDLLIRLKDALPRNDGLAADLDLLIQEIKTDPVKSISEKYITDEALPMLCSLIIEKGLTPYDRAYKLITKFVPVFAEKHLGITTVKSIVQTSYLRSYADELESATANMRMDFVFKEVDAGDIVRYKLLYEAYLLATQLTLEEAQNLTSNEAKKAVLKNDSSLFDTLNYNKYIEMCMVALSTDIAAGKVAPVDQTESSGSSAIISPEESHTFIKSKFIQVQETYKPNCGLTYTATYGGCKGALSFASVVFEKLFDYAMPSSVCATKLYEFSSNKNVILIGQLNGASAVTESSVREMLSVAALGDILQVCGKTQHTMIVVEATETGVTVYDCNKSDNFEISQYTLTYSEFAALYSCEHETSASGVSLYRAANYDTLFWDNTHIFADNSKYFVIEDGVLVKYNGMQSYVSIPAGIVEIGEEAFSNNSYIMGVELPDSIEAIGKKAFYNCENLLLCHFPDSLKTIGYYSFSECDSLSYIGLPDSVTKVDHSAFENCTALAEIDLSNNLTTVGNAAFSGTAITEIFIPKSLVTCDTAWGDGPFQCANLKTVTFEEGTTRITPELFAGCSSLKEIVIPETVTEIGASAFSECENLKSIIFEGDITTIEKGAFSHCESLSRITLPESLTTIGAGAFSSCGFSRITIPDSVTVIPSLAFANCEYLGWVTLPKNLEKLGTYAFSGCDLLQSVHIPKSLVECEGFPFSDCRNLKMVTFEEGTEAVVKNLFMGCDGLETITIPNSVTTIEEKAFYYCWNLKTVKFGNNVTTISFDAFQGCPKLTGVALPENLNKMSSHAFAECVALTEIEIPDNLTHIPYKAFADCTSLKKVTLPSTLISMGDGAFSNTAITEIHIPKSLDHCEDHYGRGPFAQCANLKTVTFEDGTKIIADNLFKKCSGIEEITIPDTVTTIEEGAFDSCTNLKKVTIPRTVANIAENAFVGSADVTIYGYIGSTAETFATENNIPFVALDDSSDEHPAEHTPAEDWTTDGTYHWKVCSIGDCGETIEETKSQHSATGSNIATCTVKAVCDVCAVSFGDYAAHSYTAQTKNEDTIKAEGNCRDAAEYYYSCSACGDIERSDLHTFAGEKVADAHVGGTCLVNVAPPDHKNQISGYSGDTQCNGCGEILEYGLPVEADEHTPAAAWTTDGEGHWRICGAESCGVVIESTKGAHTSSGENVATCQGRAVCDTCSAPYGEIADHDWATDWSSDVSGHWYICKANGCEETHAFAVHTPDHEGAATEEYAIKCSVCQFEIEPQLNTPVLKNHKVTFIADGKILDTVTVGHGQDIDLPEIPNKVGYDQIPPHWDHDGKNITEDTEITAVYIINKYIISGTVTGYSCEADTTDDMTIELWAEGATEATYTTTATGNDATYSIENVEPGTYTMKVSKPGHITREYTVVVADTAVTQDAIICPKGDVNLDGEVNADDLTDLARHVAKIEALTDDYSLLSADVDNNGSLTADDLTKLARYVAKIIPTL